MTDERIVFPNAQAVVAGWLREQGYSPVDRVVPNPRPTGAFIVVHRTGGVRNTLVTDAATLVVETWHDNDADAADLAEEVRSEVHAMIGENFDGVVVCRVDEIAGPADLPDPLSDKPRYTQTHAVHLRGTALGS